MNKNSACMNRILMGVFAFSLLGKAATVFAVANPIPIFEIQEAQGTFIQVPLTHEIYAYSQDANLQNLVVLDTEQNSLPFRLVSTALNEQAEPEIISNNLVFFPVAPNATPDSLRKLHITQINMQGNNVQIATSDTVLNNKIPEFYLVDISNLEFDISQLRLNWESQTDNQFLEVELQATRNLQDWVAVERATLVNLNQQGQTLKRNSINTKITKNSYEFLRIRVLRGAENLKITQVIAEQKNTVSSSPQKAQETWRLVGELAKTQTSLYFPSSHSKTYPVAAWEFTRNEATPIEQMIIDLGANYYGDRVTLLSRNNLNENWQLQHQGVWFNVQVGSQWQTSDAISLYRNGAKYWRLELNAQASSIGHPTLVLSWRPLALQFIANNKPPFKLAIQPDKYDSDHHEQVFNQVVVASSPSWISAKLLKLDVSQSSVINVPKPRDGKQMIFWFALTLAVAVLLFFSFTLFKQLNLQQPKP